MHMQWIPGLLSPSLLPPIRRPGDEAILSSPLSIELPTIVRVDDYTPASDFCMMLDCIRAPSDN